MTTKKYKKALNKLLNTSDNEGMQKDYEKLNKVLTTIRVKEWIIDRLREEAKKEYRSLNAEIELRLQRSIERDQEPKNGGAA